MHTSTLWVKGIKGQKIHTIISKDYYFLTNFLWKLPFYTVNNRCLLTAKMSDIITHCQQKTGEICNVLLGHIVKVLLSWNTCFLIYHECSNISKNGVNNLLMIILWFSMSEILVLNCPTMYTLAIFVFVSSLGNWSDKKRIYITMLFARSWQYTCITKVFDKYLVIKLFYYFA